MPDYASSIQMKYLTDEDPRYDRLCLLGDLDKAGLDAIKDDINKAVDELQKNILIFDFKDMNFINSEGIGFLITIYYRLLKKEKRLVIINATDHVFDVLDVIGVTKIVNCFDGIDSFKLSL